MSDAEPISENNAGHDAEHTSDSKDRKPTPNTPPADGPPDPPPAVTHHHITYKPEKDWWDKAKPFVEIGGAVLLLIYTTYTIKMYCTNKEAAEAATSAANTATQALNKSIDQFRVDERAWIEIERIEKTMVSARTDKFGAAFRYRLYPKNIGKTEAHAIEVSAPRSMQSSIGLESNADNMKREQEMLLNRSTPGELPVVNPAPRVLAPGATAAVPFVMDGQEPHGEWVSYLIGRIDYADDFGVKHWMEFCFYVGEPNGELWNCHEGNDEDNNRETTPSPKQP
jgi:hypothetical protein